MRTVIGALNRFAKVGDAKEFEHIFDALPAPLALAAQGALSDFGLVEAAIDAATMTSQGNLRRRLHGWFDALRTLRFLHALRDAGVRDLGWQMAIQSASFVSIVGGLDCKSVLARLVELESQLPACVGASTG